jgi:hypothetical protein
MANKTDLLSAMERIDTAEPCKTHGKTSLAVCNHCLQSQVYCEACRDNPYSCGLISANSGTAVGSRRVKGSPP